MNTCLRKESAILGSRGAVCREKDTEHDLAHGRSSSGRRTLRALPAAATWTPGRDTRGTCEAGKARFSVGGTWLKPRTKFLGETDVQVSLRPAPGPLTDLGPLGFSGAPSGLFHFSFQDTLMVLLNKREGPPSAQS